MGKLSRKRKKPEWKPFEVPIVIPKNEDPKAEVMDYNESFHYSSWTITRELADKILENVKKKGVKVKLDDLTQGKGSCFMIAIHYIQPCFVLF